MKYLARLMTALAVIISVAVALVTAIVNVTATAAAYGIATIGDTITARLGGHEGGMQRFVHRTQAILLVPYRAASPFFYTMATNATFGLRPGHGALVGTMTLTTRTYQGHKHQLRTTTINGYRPADGTKGFRRWLSRTIPTGTGLRTRLA
ncbi:MAG: hypothetical protein Q7K38_03515 [Candidatus Wildermuthbacteria bacterium]|nr:hypothetical protein [Candidatus Wildermuthbacteria bacterium]